MSPRPLSRLRARLAQRRHRYAPPLAELVRIESDPAYRALFWAELDVAVQERFASRAAVVADVEAAAERLRELIRLGGPGRPA
ncbi:hypothetical protein [Streptomyces sp. NPDC026589]|uniref:hypothetical protein n=1 Tax=Streptomyces sp. NPDC026589 TaxID=3155609 RepID=UPI0033CFE563